LGQALMWLALRYIYVCMYVCMYT